MVFTVHDVITHIPRKMSENQLTKHNKKP